MQDTTQEQRINQRKEILQALLADKPNFKLVQLMLATPEPIIVDLDFTAKHLPGMYRRQVITHLGRLEELGIVTLSPDKLAYERGRVFSEPEEIAATLVNLIFS